MNRYLILAIAVALTGAVSPATRAADEAEAVTAAQSSRAGQDAKHCSATANTQFLACRSDIVDSLYTTQALCGNVSDGAERGGCFTGATAAYRDDLETCRAQQAARLDLCEVLGEERYEPDFDPESFDADFDNPLSPNPYFPIAIGNKWVYAGGDESFSDEVLEQTKLIEGVTCIVVRASAKLDGRLIELTDDWYARRLDGDLVYCGEEVKNYHTFEGDDPADPELVDIGGSFKVGRGALAGLLFPRFPTVGQTYRQEWAPGEAEDVAEVVSVTYRYGADAKLDKHVPQDAAEMFCPGDCIVTRDYSPIAPGAFAHKYYARGMGLVFEVSVDAEGHVEVFQLVECNVDPRCSALPGAATQE